MKWEIRQGDAISVLKTLEAESVHTCVTSPPYWALRDYGVEGQLGLEATPEAYIKSMVEVFREVKRVLRSDGTIWVNIGDSYFSGGGSGWQGKNGDRGNRRHSQRNLQSRAARAVRDSGSDLKPKDMVGIPWMLAFALRADGWYLRRDIIWHKRNPMPESCKDRCTTSHEYIFHLSKSADYYYDFEAIKEPASPDTHARYARSGSVVQLPGAGVNPKASEKKDVRFKVKQNSSFAEACSKEIVENRNKRSVWTLSSAGYSGDHFATYPPKLIEPCILAGAPRGGGRTRSLFRKGDYGHGRASARPPIPRDRAQSKRCRRLDRADPGRLSALQYSGGHPMTSESRHLADDSVKVGTVVFNIRHPAAIEPGASWAKAPLRPAKGCLCRRK